MLARMDAIRARALLARAPGLSAEHLRALMLAAGGEPARAAERRAAREVQLPPATRGFLGSPDEAALDADLAWLAASGARIILCTDPDYPPLLGQSAGAPAAQPHHQRACARHAGGRGRAPQRLAHHRAPGGGTGARGVCDPGLHPQSALARLPPTPARRREAGGGSRGRSGGAADFGSERNTYDRARAPATAAGIGQGV